MTTSTTVLLTLMSLSMFYNIIGLRYIKNKDVREGVEIMVNGIYIGLAIGVMINLSLPH